MNIRHPACLLATLLLTACATPQQQLMSATVKGDPAGIRTALQKGGDVNAVMPDTTHADKQCPDARTALQLAVCRGDAATVKLLLASGAKPDAGPGASPLVTAAMKGNAAIAGLLLDAGAVPDLQSAGKTALTAADGAALVNLLLAHKASPALLDGGGETPLVHAARLGHADMVQLLLAAGASADQTTRGGVTPLMVAANADTARALLAAKADTAPQDSNGNNALMYAAIEGRADVATVLLQHGMDVRLRNKDGATAADLAEASGAAGKVLREARDAAQKSDMDARLRQADLAAAAGNFDKALADDLAALALAEKLGPDTERVVRLRLLQSVAAWPAPPAVPDAAHDHIVRSQLILQHNGSATDAEAELRQVTELAPWWADGYFNLGLVQGSSGNYRQAVNTLKLFVEGAPDNPRVQQARDKIIEFQFDQEQRDAMAALAGQWSNADNSNDIYAVSVDGDHLNIVSAGGGLTVTAIVKDRELNGTIDGASYAGEHNCTIPPQSHPVSGHISSDGKRIDLQYVWSSFSTNYQCATMFNEVVACGGMAITHDVCTAVTLNGSNSMRLVLQRP